MVIKQRFKVGDNLLTKVTADYLNSIEQRLNQIMNIKGHAPIDVSRTLNGISISLLQHIDKFQFGQLNAELDEDGEQTVNLIARDSTLAAGSQWTEDTTLQVTVADPVGTRIPDNSIGLIFDHFMSDVKTKIFWPFPERLFYIETTAPVASASNFSCKLLDLDGSDTGDTITVENPVGLWDDVETAKKGIAIKIAEEYHGIFFDISSSDWKIDAASGGPLTVDSTNNTVKIIADTDITTSVALNGAVYEVNLVNEWFFAQATVNEVSGVTPSDLTFAVDNIETCFGKAHGLTQTVSNDMGITAANDDVIYICYNRNGGASKWEVCGVAGGGLDTITMSAITGGTASGSPVNLAGTTVDFVAGQGMNIVGNDAGDSVTFNVIDPLFQLQDDAAALVDVNHTDIITIAGIAPVTVTKNGASTLDIALSGNLWSLLTDDGFVRQVEWDEDVDFEGDGSAWDVGKIATRLGIRTRSVVDSSIQHAVEFQLNETPLQQFELSGAQSSGDATVNVENGTENSITLAQSAGDGIAVAGTDVSGTITYTISTTDALWIAIDDAASSNNVTFGETITFSEGNGMQVDVVTSTIIFAIDDSVAQNIALTGAGASGTNPVLITAHPTANTFGLVAGTNITLVGGAGTVTIASTGGGGTDWSVRADAGTDSLIDATRIVVDFDGGAVNTSVVDLIKTTVSDTAGVATLKIQGSTSIATKRDYTTSTGTYIGETSGDVTVPVDEGTANSLDWKAGAGVKFTTTAISGITELEIQGLYAKATANSGDGASVAAILCDDNIHTTESGVITLYIQNGAQGNNIRSGDVVACFKMRDGKYVTNAGASMPKLTMQMWLGTVAAIPEGWEVMDGTANSAGSGIAMYASGDSSTASHTQRIPIAYDNTDAPPGVVIGDNDHTHDPHDDHSHTMGRSANALGSVDVDNDGDQLNACTGGVRLISNCVTAPGGDELGHTPTETVPRSMEVHFIERVS